VHPHNVRDEALIARAEQAEHVQNAGDRACGEGSAAEAEEVDVVAFLVDIHQVAIGVGYVLQNACSDGETGDDGDSGSQPVGGGGRAFGAYSGMVVPDLPFAVDDEGSIELDDVRVVVAVLVSGAVAADDDILRHSTSFNVLWNESYWLRAEKGRCFAVPRGNAGGSRFAL